MTNEQIKEIFTYHKPFGTQQDRYEKLRNVARVMAQEINEMCPESREKSLALTNLQQAIMWANASIAINEKS
jgi:glycyl-tRNA synthetase beta subunit